MKRAEIQRRLRAARPAIEAARRIFQREDPGCELPGAWCVRASDAIGWIHDFMALHRGGKKR
jgi:1,2-phenylacetyl-CoA epoxidase PaaB subunit